MGFYIRRRVPLGKRTWVNVSKSGVSASHRRVNRRGQTVTVNTRGNVWIKIARGFGYRRHL
jgi:hypothetical protein